MTLFSILAANDNPNPMGEMWIFFILMFVVIYFIAIRPQSKQRKELQARISSMEKGDKVVTIGGMHGVVHQINKETVNVRVSEGTIVRFEKEAIRTVNKLRKEKKDGDQAEAEDTEEETEESTEDKKS